MSRDAERLARLLARWEAGELGDAPEADEELSELIDTARAVRRLRKIPPPPHRLQPGRAAFVTAGVQRARGPGQAEGRGGWRALLRLPRRAGALSAAMLAVVLLVGSGLMASAAADSLPGDALYGVKRLGESIHLAVTRNDESRATLLERQSETRRHEARSLLAQGRVEQVTIEGPLERAPDGTLRVGGVPLDAAAWHALGDDAVSLRPGAHVQLTGLTTPEGVLRPSSLRVIAPVRQPSPTAMPPTPEPPPTTTQPTAIATASATSATPTRVTATATATPQPTATAPATATADVILPEPGERVPTVVWEGQLEAAAGSVWRVAGRSFRLGSGVVDEAAGRALPGAWVRVEAERRDGELWLVRLEVLGAAAPPTIVEWRGPIEAIAPTQWVVDGRAVQIDARTRITGDPAVGRTASVRAEQQPDGSMLALEISVAPTSEVVEFAGRLSSFDGSAWIVDGQRVALDGATEVIGTPLVGARVEVRARREPDGRLVALRLRVLDTAPVQPTPTPALATATTPASATPPPTPSPTVRPPFPTPGATPMPQPPPFATSEAAASATPPAAPTATAEGLVRPDPRVPGPGRD